MQLIELRNHLDTLLDAQRLKDYCPNGLQVEGRPEVLRVLCGVTASQALLDRAVAGGHDAVFVHHGLFWKGEDGRVTGFRRQRLRALLANDINLFAYHLPLDAHPELGNNAQLGKRMGWQGEGRFADQDLGWIGRPREPGQRAQTIADALAQTLGRVPLLVGDGEQRACCEARAEARGIRRQVEFLGQRDDIPALLSAADAFVLPSLHEGLPLTLIEAQCAGLSCLASEQVTRESALTDLVSFAPIDDAEAFAGAMARLAMPERVEASGEAIRRVAEAGYDVSQNADALMRLYESLTGRRQD